LELHVFNSELELCGLAEEISSLIWKRSFFTSGSFTLTAPATAECMRLLKKHMLVEKEGEVGVITSLNIDKDEKSEKITASGILLTGTLNNRILLETDSSFMGLLDKNIGGAASASRRIPKLFVSRDISAPSDYHDRLLYANLGAYAEAVCRKNGIGLRATLEHSGGRRIKLEAVRGVDKSIGQSVNPRVIFSEDFDNLRGVKYQYSENGAVSTVYGYAVIPAGISYTGGELVRVEGDGNVGYDRIESSKSVRAETYNSLTQIIVGFEDDYTPIYKDQIVSGVSQQNTIASIDSAIEGTSKPPAENFSGSVRFEGGYKSQYDLGDIVTVLHNRWGMSDSIRICEVVERYENGGVTISPVFGSPLPTIMDILKRE